MGEKGRKGLSVVVSSESVSFLFRDLCFDPKSLLNEH
jgi:hypothetical protein